MTDAIKNKSVENYPQIFEFIRTTGALSYTYDHAKNYCQKALRAISPLKDSPFKEALIGLANFATARTY